MKTVINTIKLQIDAKSCNESFARTAVASFAAQLDPTIDEINDLKTAVSEAVTNCIVHSNSKTVLIEASLWRNDREEAVTKKPTKILTEKYQCGIAIAITDFGTGIANIEKALEPFYTTKPDQERSGMGFTVMQSFMDSLKVTHAKPSGTIVQMTKTFNNCAGA
ncbi:MAG: anti-sigma F factor [Christensenellaceae bacterium]|jgi:stage II sporulation protein AB (anti-sigma F factor)|nr:anti-sigma F factor [Christensenellaceae bacterium]